MAKKKSLNEIVADKTRAHVFDLMKLSNYERDKVLNQLSKLQKSLFKDLIDSGIDGEKGMTAHQQPRLEALLANATGTIGTAFQDIAETQHTEMMELAETEANWASRAVNTSVKIRLLDNFITKEQTRTIVSETLVEGAPSSEWWSRQSSQTEKAFKDTMRQGMLRGETLQQLSQRVMGGKRGDKEIEGIPDLMGKPRRNAEALVRSSVMAVSGETRRKLYEGNEDVVKGIVQLSTFDGRTTEICMAYSGATYDMDYNPIPPTTLPYGSGVPRHWGCRSVEVPLMKDLSEITGIDGLDELPDGMRASLDGQIPVDTTFDEWLKNKEEQEPGYADHMLGAGKAQLWRTGELTFQDLINDRGGAKSLTTIRQELGLDSPEPSYGEANYAPPKAGTTVAKVWEIADNLGAGGQPVLRKDVIKAAIDAGVNPATAATQFAKWRAERGTGGVNPPPVIVEPPTPPVIPVTPGITPPEKPAVAVARPKAGTASAQIWDLADELSKDGTAVSQKVLLEKAKELGG